MNAFLPEPGDAGLEASRSSNDRLMIFINERPVVMPDISKVMLVESLNKVTHASESRWHVQNCFSHSRENEFTIKQTTLVHRLWRLLNYCQLLQIPDEPVFPSLHLHIEAFNQMHL
jgi:hypothetical protein